MEMTNCGCVIYQVARYCGVGGCANYVGDKPGKLMFCEIHAAHGREVHGIYKKENKMSEELKIEKSKVLAAAEKCSQFKGIAKDLWPTLFKPEIKVGAVYFIGSAWGDKNQNYRFIIFSEGKYRTCTPDGNEGASAGNTESLAVQYSKFDRVADSLEEYFEKKRKGEL